LCYYIYIMIIYSFWANRLYKRFTNLGSERLMKKHFRRMQLAADVIIILIHTHWLQLWLKLLKHVYARTHARARTHTHTHTHALKIIIFCTWGKRRDNRSSSRQRLTLEGKINKISLNNDCDKWPMRVCITTHSTDKDNKN